MFGKSPTQPMQVETTTFASPSTYIAKGVTLEGILNCEGDIVIDGKVKGPVTTQGAISLGAEATVDGKMKSASLKSAGTINGDCEIELGIELLATSKTIGKVTGTTIVVERGASIKGEMVIETKTT